MKRTRSFAAKIGDGGFLDGFLGSFPEGFWADFIAQLLQGWMAGGCALATDGAHAKEQAEEAWDESARRGKGGYDRDVFRRARLSVHAEAKKAGRQHGLRRVGITPRETKEAARLVLDAIRFGDPSEMTEVILENE